MYHHPTLSRKNPVFEKNIQKFILFFFFVVCFAYPVCENTKHTGNLKYLYTIL